MPWVMLEKQFRSGRKAVGNDDDEIKV
jgi:hypothetical protein